MEESSYTERFGKVDYRPSPAKSLAYIGQPLNDVIAQADVSHFERSENSNAQFFVDMSARPTRSRTSEERAPEIASEVT